MPCRTHAPLWLAVFVVACGDTGAPEPRDVTAEIHPLAAQFTDAFAQRNTAAIADLYTEDAKVFPPGSDIVSGRVAIEEFWRGAMEAGIARVALSVEEATAVGGIAYEVGRYTLFDSAGAPMDEGKYVVVWRETEDGWRLHRDIWNSNRVTP